MPMFQYRVKTPEGEMVDAVLAAESRQEALALVRKRVPGVILRMEEELRSVGAGHATTLPPARRLRLRGGRIKTTDLTTLFRQISVSVNAGVSLREALEAILEDLEHQRLRVVVQAICDRLHEGSSFSLALSEHRSIFPPVCIALVRAAEEAGTMAETLDEMATTMEKSDALARKIKSIMAYPMFVAGFFGLVLLIMTIFILPQFQEVFDNWNAKLPTLTVVVFDLNKFIIKHAVIELAILSLLIGAFLVWRRTPVGRAHLDRFKLNAPAIGPVVMQIGVARFCKYFAMMVRGGVPIAAAMEIAAEVTGNQVLEKNLLAAREEILLGSDIGSALARQGEIFPRLLVRMISIGESSGRLPDTLDKVAETYESRVEASIAIATSLLEPVIIVFFGGLILVLVLAIYLPVFSTASSVQ
ncbi:MAG TPA: type II secretion system F family protein [Kiritimatiellia bacterium]|nr:type II secretion system F family protein [Kiritimatiellia bacterium]